MKNIPHNLRHHLHFFIIAPLLIILMTWPTASQLFDTRTFWLTGHNIDTNMLFWDAWYGKLILSGQADFFYTDLLFHPDGVSLAFHNFSLPHMALFAGLQELIPAPNAYNLTYLLLVFLNMASGYLYLQYLFRDKWIGLFGAIVFGTSAFTLGRPAHPNIAFIATLPLSLYFFHRALRENRHNFFIISGVLIGLTAFIGMYTLVCLLITLLFCILYFARQHWKDISYWRMICLLCLVVAAFGLLRFYPMIVDSQGLADALTKNENSEIGKDLLGYFVNTEHPIIEPLLDSLLSISVLDNRWHPAVFLGYIPLFLITLGFAKSTRRRKMLPWLLLALPFLLLRLGSFLTINDVDYHHILLPKHYLTQVIPQLFSPFWATDNFHAGTLLPFAVLACYGLATLLQSVRIKWRVTIILIIAGTVAFEYYQPPKSRVIPDQQFDFIDWLKSEPNQESIRLINLPMGGQRSKHYAFHQTFTGYPHAEGRPTRTPTSAFNYINNNLLLSNWRAWKSVHCSALNAEDYLAAANQLLDDGFTHLILHHWIVNLNRFTNSLVFVLPSYADDYVTIYRVRDIRETCAKTAAQSTNALPQIRSLLDSETIPKIAMSILSLQPANPIQDNTFHYFSQALTGWKSWIHLYTDDKNVLHAQNSAEPDADLDYIVSTNDILLLTTDRGQTAFSLPDQHRQWLARHYRSCGAVTASEDLVIEYYLKPAIPCELVFSQQPWQVRYRNGILLANLLVEADAKSFSFYPLWQNLPSESHAISIQFFSEDGDKVQGRDYVISLGSLTERRIDLSALAPGDYIVKMILYDYATQASVPGTALGSNTDFERELEIARVTVE